MHIFIALLIYISIVSTLNISSYQNKDKLTIYKLIDYITFFRFQQIKRYFYVSPPLTPTSLSAACWYTKLKPLSNILCTKIQEYVVLGQNVSFDKMIVPFSRRSRHTLKIKNKPVSEGFKVQALCDCRYLQDFLFYSRTSSKFAYKSAINSS